MSENQDKHKPTMCIGPVKQIIEYVTELENSNSVGFGGSEIRKAMLTDRIPLGLQSELPHSVFQLFMDVVDPVAFH